MQFLVSVIANSHERANDSEAAAIDVFNERLIALGHWRFAAGLTAPSSAVVIDNRNGEASASNGPIVDAEEFVAGFWIWDCADMDSTLEFAVEGSKACNRKLEVRAILGS